MSAPLISIGIPTYNRSSSLVRTVRSALRQRYEALEVIVSDDASTDDTAARLAELNDPRLVVIRQPSNLGIIGNFNACLAKATGEYFLLLNDDDTLAPEAVYELVAPFVSGAAGHDGSEIGLSWCRANVVDAEERLMWVSEGGPPAEPTLDFLEGYFAGTRGLRFCGVLLRRADVVAAGGYEERYGYICDVGSWAAVALMYPLVACVPEPVANYTIHVASNTGLSTGDRYARWSAAVIDDLIRWLAERGRAGDARRLRKCRASFIGNARVAVILQGVGRPGWFADAARNFIAGGRYFISPPMFRRLAREAWKLMKLRVGGRSWIRATGVSPSRSLRSKLRVLAIRGIPDVHYQLARATRGMASVLDVACGSETSPFALVAVEPGQRRTGIDLFAPSVERSRAAGIHQDYIVADIFAVDLRERSFDCVVALDVVEHFEKAEGYRFLDRLESLARRRVVIVTPNGFVPQEPFDGNESQRHRSGWTTGELVARGYTVRGALGLQPLRGEYALPVVNPAVIGQAISMATQYLAYAIPERAFALFAVKDLQSISPADNRGNDR